MGRFTFRHCDVFAVFHQVWKKRGKDLIMHELSVVMSIIDIASKEAVKAKAITIDEIEMDIGCLSSIEMNAFEFAWQQGIKETILEKSLKKINRIGGKAKCLQCETNFPVENIFDACPVCGEHLLQILEGKELRVKSLVVS
jgi:hydrogenase nickel incorporation protein HypA/HybF